MGGGDDAAAGVGDGFAWDADSQLYYHASTAFYHDPVAGWYYSSRDSQYYVYKNGNYMPLTTDLENEPTANHPYDEANQDVLEHSSGLETTILDNENEIPGPPSEWMEETLINLYLSGYSNNEVNAESSLVIAHSNEEEKWHAQYGQVERSNDDQHLPPTIDIWDWDVVQDHVNKGQPVVRLVGCLSRGSNKLHPSLPTRGGLVRTAPVREVHLDLVQVSTGKLYRLRNPSRKYLATLSAYDSSNPTKDWGFPDINLNKQSTAKCQSEVLADKSCGGGSVSAANTMEPNTKVYRDRAAERRILHRGLGVGPGQKQSNTNNFDEYEESIEDMDSMGVASADLNFQSSGLLSAKRIMENMGWKQGEALGKSRKGIVEPIQPSINKHGAGLGWRQTR